LPGGAAVAGVEPNGVYVAVGSYADRDVSAEGLFRFVADAHRLFKASTPIDGTRQADIAVLIPGDVHEIRGAYQLRAVFAVGSQFCFGRSHPHRFTEGVAAIAGIEQGNARIFSLVDYRE